MVFEVIVKVEDDVGCFIFKIKCLKKFQVLSTLLRALNSAIHVRYKGYSVAYYYSTRYHTVVPSGFLSVVLPNFGNTTE
jgi:hypothetical protein